MRHGDDHIFALDQILIINFAFVFDDFSAAWCGKIGFNVGQFVFDDRTHAITGTQDFEIVFDFDCELFELSRNFFEA